MGCILLWCRNKTNQTRSNAFDYKKFKLIIREELQKQGNQVENSQQYMLNQSKCVLLDHYDKHIEGICVNEECKAANRRMCFDCLNKRVYDQDCIQNKQFYQPLNADQLGNVIKHYKLLLNGQIDHFEYSLYLEQLKLTSESNEKIACIKMQELEKIEIKIKQAWEIIYKMDVKEYIKQQYTTNIGIFNYCQYYNNEVDDINRKLNEYKNQISNSKDVSQYRQVNIEEFNILKKKKQFIISKIIETSQYKNQEIDEKDKKVIQSQIRDIEKQGKCQKVEQSIIQRQELQIQQNPNDCDTLLKIGQQFNDQGKFEQAINMYNKAIAKNSKFYQAFNSKGISLQNLQRYQEAIHMYDIAIQLNDNNQVAYNNKGICLQNLNLYEEAEQTFDKAKRSIINQKNR